MNDYIYDAVARLTKYFAGIHCILYVETVILLCSAIYSVYSKQYFSLRSIFQMVCDLSTMLIAWFVYALYIILLDGLGTWSENFLVIQNRMEVSTMCLSLLAFISLVLKLVLLKRKKQQGGGVFRK